MHVPDGYLGPQTYAPAFAVMGGFWVIDVPDLDTALDWAKRATVACELPVEVRPFHG